MALAQQPDWITCVLSCIKFQRQRQRERGSGCKRGACLIRSAEMISRRRCTAHDRNRDRRLLQAIDTHTHTHTHTETQRTTYKQCQHLPYAAFSLGTCADAASDAKLHWKMKTCAAILASALLLLSVATLTQAVRQSQAMSRGNATAKAPVDDTQAIYDYYIKGAKSEDCRKRLIKSDLCVRGLSPCDMSHLE